MRARPSLLLALLAVLGLAPVISSSSAAATAHFRYPLRLPDLQIEVPTDPGVISIGTNGDTGDTQLQFTHITWNAGTGPFVITPHLNKRTGVATFTQTIYQGPGGTKWTKAEKIPLAVNGIFDSPTDYRYPLTSFTLIHAPNGPNGPLGATVATSPKVDYCITSDVTVGGVPDMPGRQSPPQSNCGHPNKPLGLAVGYGDQYDETDNGQPIDLTGVPLDGSEYLLKALVDPQHIFTESNASNDETDTYLTLNSDSTVTVLSQSGPPQSVPSITLASPSAGAPVSGEIPLAVSTRAASAPIVSVQYLLDGEPLGAPVASAPYSATVPAAAVGSGAHLLSARVTDARGAMATAPVQKITVSAVASSTSPRASASPSIVISNPGSGQIESGTVPVAAVVNDAEPGVVVQFELDGNNLGAPVTSAPYAMSWRTGTATNGSHTLTADLTDAAGDKATTAPVVVQVTNPSTPMTCFVKQVDVSAHGRGTLTTAAFRTMAKGETLVVLVTAHGRANHLGVHGAGLHWRLLRKVTSKAGVAEAFAATAPHLLRHVHVTSTESEHSASQSLRVIGMEGVGRAGATAGATGASGNPHARLVTSDDTSLVLAAGIDNGGRPSLPKGWVAGQPLSAAGPGTWTQYTNWPTGAKGTAVSVGDASTVTGPWSLVAVELTGDDS